MEKIETLKESRRLGKRLRTWEKRGLELHDKERGSVEFLLQLLFLMKRMCEEVERKKKESDEK